MFRKALFVALAHGVRCASQSNRMEQTNEVASAQTIRNDVLYGGMVGTGHKMVKKEIQKTLNRDYMVGSGCCLGFDTYDGTSGL